MTKKKEPATDVPTPEQVLQNAPLDVLMDALAKLAGESQGKDGAELQAYIGDVRSQVDLLVKKVESSEEEAVQKKAVSAQVEQLIDSVIQSGTKAGVAVARNRDAIKNSFKGVDLDGLAQGLRLFADWLQHPSDTKEADVKALIERLQKTMGAAVGYDPEREDRERRASIKADVAASLDEIFRGKPKPQ